jgi:C-terminal processing protease CtpA/Prc
VRHFASPNGSEFDTAMEALKDVRALIRSLPHGFQMFLPVGRTYDARTGKGWETEGIQPDIEVPYGDALETAIAQIR